jgi:hypothetical protein
MNTSRIRRVMLILGIALGATIIACGSDGKKKNPVDGSTDDSGGNIDSNGSGSGGISGLGQHCGSGFPACPANAPDCIAVAIGSAASPSYCTPHCLDGGSGTTNNQGQLTATTPPPDNTKCSAAYTGGSVGTPACGLLLSYMPMDVPLKKNMTYTSIVLGCVVACGAGNTCPTGMTCNATAKFCFPN